MKPFWVTFRNAQQSSYLTQGVGVTAHDVMDATAIVRSAFEDDLEVDDVRWVQSLDELDQGHVRPNMGNHLKRGVWYPAFSHDQRYD